MKERIEALLWARAERFATKRKARAANRAFIVMSGRALLDHGATSDMGGLLLALAKAGVAGLGPAFQAKLLLDLEEDVLLHDDLESMIEKEEEAAAVQQMRATRDAKMKDRPQVKFTFETEEP